MSVSPAMYRVIQALENHGSKGRGSSWQCVAHEDNAPSLSVRHGEKGVTIKCHANCPTEDVVAALGLTMADLFDEPMEKKERPQVVAEYPYCDEHGQVLKVVRRIEPGYNGERKTFRQFRPDGKPGVKGIRDVPYCLPDVLATAAAGGIILIPEGEKDVESLRALGVVATTNIGGAGSWRDEHTQYLRGAKEVVVIADRDDVGRKHAAQVADSCARAGIPVRVMEPAKGKDVSDHLAAGLGYEDLQPSESHPTNPRNPGDSQDADPHGSSGISGTRITDTGWEEPLPEVSPRIWTA